MIKNRRTSLTEHEVKEYITHVLEEIIKAKPDYVK